MAGIMGVSSFRENKIAARYSLLSFFSCLAFPLSAKSAGFSMTMMRGRDGRRRAFYSSRGKKFNDDRGDCTPNAISRSSDLAR